MSASFKQIAIIGREDDPRVTEPVEALTAHLTEAGITVLSEQDSAAADLLIAIGGDGTMLYAGRLAREHDTPILGINRGRLGFLADITPDDMIASVDHVLAGDYSTDSRLLLKATLTSADGSEEVGYALNDVVIQRADTGRLIDIETSIDGSYVNTHSGDGLIIATPTGSTAYALSCGGPIIQPKLNAVVVVPVCPHTLTDRPIVLAAEQEIEVKLLEREDTRADITVDGFATLAINPGDKLVVSAANSRVTLVHPPGYDFYGILRSKLFWGQDSRNRGG